jgi:hypothetical protein
MSLSTHALIIGSAIWSLLALYRLFSHVSGRVATAVAVVAGGLAALHSGLAAAGFYADFRAVPPRLLLVFLPSLGLLVWLLRRRSGWLASLPLRQLTLLHVVRFPVEIYLFRVFQADLIPQAMTFEGRNFDIVMGITAPVLYWWAFRRGGVDRHLLLVWNLMGLMLLTNIVATAALSTPSPIQRFGFEQPNVAIADFPFILLPALVVPVVLLAHVVGIWRLATTRLV